MIVVTVLVCGRRAAYRRQRTSTRSVSTAMMTVRRV